MEIPKVMIHRSNDILEHHGVDGQRWGVTHGPPYPLDRNKDRQARKAAKLEKKKQRERAKRLKKARKTRKKNLEAKKKEAAKKEKEAKKAENEKKRKEKIYKRASPAKLYRNRQIINTKDEIQGVLDRFDWEQKIQQYSKTRLANTADKAKSIVSLMNSAIGGYNSIAGVYNAWFPDEEPLPHINVGGKSGNKSGDQSGNKSNENKDNKDDKKKGS